MQSHHLETKRTGHYYTIGTAGKHIKKIWIACHGYGQQANKMIYKFEEVEDGETFIVAPEGLNKFYFKGPQVGATWMTSKDRLFEIEDYCNWLEQIYNLFVPQMHDDVQITLFGFSQGGTTMMRFLHNRQIDFDNLIIWAGDIPQDISYLELEEYLMDKKKFLVIGDEDQFINAEKIAAKEDFLKEQKMDFEVIWFKGKHVIDRPTLREVAAKL